MKSPQEHLNAELMRQDMKDGARRAAVFAGTFLLSLLAASFAWAGFLQFVFALD